jgi:hypothetical protein
MFHIPVVLFLFKRKDTLEQIISRIREIAPCKVYIVADGPRNEDERTMTDEVREYVESLIDWDCEVVKNYSENNRGVYHNIGLGAKWVLSLEDSAIFLEDDNLPEITFFEYCRELLELYEEDSRVLWICGTNYLGNKPEVNGASYFFTQHLLPCGWASWSHKFNMYYDGDLKLLNDDSLNYMEHSYKDNRLFKQDADVILKTKRLLDTDPQQASWDRQMIFSLRLHGVYGISPVQNQIKNIGADEFSTHGGTSTNKVMTGRFCEIPTQEISFPMSHPKFVLPEPEYDKAIAEIILYPFYMRAMLNFIRVIKPFFGIKKDESLMPKIKALAKKYKLRG